MVSLDIVQVAYHVTDIRRAAMDMVNRVGAGPFFVRENIRLTWGQHRGRATDFVHSSAYGQWGHLMVEFLQQVDGTKHSPYRDMYRADQEGLHHVAIMVDDLEQAFAHFEENHMPVVTRCGLSSDKRIDFAFVDARATLGHMIELYPTSTAVVKFYDLVREAAIDWNGEQPLRGIDKA